MKKLTAGLPLVLQEIIGAARGYSAALTSGESRPLEAPLEIWNRLRTAGVALSEAMRPAIGPAAVIRPYIEAAFAHDRSLEMLALAVRVFGQEWPDNVGHRRLAGDAVIVALCEWESCDEAKPVPEKGPGDAPVRLTHRFELAHEEVRAVRVFDDMLDRLGLELLEVWGRRHRHRSGETSW